MNKEDRPEDPTASSAWKVDVSHDAALTYSFTGAHNSSASAQILRFNYTQCDAPSLTLYNGTLLGDTFSSSSDASAADAPTVNATFSNNSAVLVINGHIRGKSIDVRNMEVNMTVVFNGTIDQARSDRLISNTRGYAPLWEPTLGYVKNLTGERVLWSARAGTIL